MDKDLPQGWCYARLSDLGELARGKSKHRPRNDPKLYGNVMPFIQTGEVARSGGLIRSFSKMYSEFGVQQSRVFPKGTICITIAANIADTGILDFDACFPDSVVGLISNDALADSHFVEFFLQTAREDIAQFAPATAQANINLEILNKVVVPLPPLNEQRRIVAKIEALKARSQRVKEELEAITPLLDQFRQSVLAAAFRGDLTADWREKNPHFTGEWHNNLLTAVRYAVTQTKRQGRLWGSGTSLQEVHESWAKLPDTWNWVKVIDLGYDPDVVVQIGPMSMKSEEFTETGTTVLNVGCVQWNGLNLEKCNYLPPARAADFERYRVCKGDVLFTRSGAVGRSAIVTPEVDGALITFHLLRVRTSSEICIPEYLYFAFRGCSAVRSQIDDSAIGATRAGFNTKLLQNIWLPLPPSEEQAQILQEIKKRFKFADSIMGQISEGASFLDKLDRSILAKAFRGELVPQDPNDEPASVLLERIRAERENLDTKKKAKGKTEKKNRKAKPEAAEPEQLSLPGFE
jgi:type I restriction enzyme S subunit